MEVVPYSHKEKRQPKMDNMRAAMSLYMAFYNFVRPHKSLNGATPAMAHGIEKSFWTVADLLRY